MNATYPPETRLLPLPLRDIVLLGLAGGVVLAVWGITSFFCLSAESATLRESAISGLNVTCNKKIALHIGALTTALVRTGSHLFKLAPEPQAAFDAIRGAEVGIYKLQEDAGWVDHRAILARADKAMSARRWDRVVGVSQRKELVAVYVPGRGISATRLRCCVLVLQGRDLIVAGVSGNLEPLFEIAGKHFDLSDATQHLALR